MTDNEIHHSITVAAEDLERIENNIVCGYGKTMEEVCDLADFIQVQLNDIADAILGRMHRSKHPHNDPNYNMTDGEYADNMHDLIQWELEAARDSAINGESNEERHRHILAALDAVRRLTDRTAYTPPPKHDPNCPF